MPASYAKGKQLDITLTASGLTTGATPYTSGDVLGGQMSHTFAAQGDCAIEITSVVITDASAVIGATDLYLFNATTTPAADNAAFNPSDAEAATCIGVISATTVFTHTANKIVTWGAGLEEVSVYLPTGILYVVAVTRTANNQFGSATALQYRIGFRACW